MQAKRRKSRCKRYVEVLAHFSFEGEIRPFKFRDEEGGVYRIERILDVRPAASLKAGGAGIRYICRVGPNVIHLYHDGDSWFIEVEA